MVKVSSTLKLMTHLVSRKQFKEHNTPTPVLLLHHHPFLVPQFYLNKKGGMLAPGHSKPRPNYVTLDLRCQANDPQSHNPLGSLPTLTGVTSFSV